MRDEFKARRDMMLLELRSIPGLNVNEPGGAFYLYPEVSHYIGRSYNGRKITSSNELCEYLLEEVHLALVSGEAFGTPGFIRISYAASQKDLKEAMNRLKKGLAQLT